MRVQEHETRIRRMFDAIAPGYDRLNHTLSFGQDLLWRIAAARRARLGPGEVALDVGTGTGDLALALLKRSDATSRVVGLDLAREMFALALAKAARRGLRGRFDVVQGSALDIPAPDASFDRVVSAFTLRNVADLSLAFAEMRRVLRPGGRVVLLELSKPRDGTFARVYRTYLYGVLPRAASLLGGDPAAYAYLPDSLTPFPDADGLARALQAGGLRDVRYTRLTFGIAAIHEATR